MIRNAVNMSCHVMSCHVTNHLNFLGFSIAKIFSLNQFIFCPFFADISNLILIEEKEESSLV